MNDKIKLAGLEALILEELEKHLILNSNRLRTFNDARREVVTYVEAEFGLIIPNSEPSDTGLREHSDVGAVSSLSSVEGKRSSVSKRSRRGNNVGATRLCNFCKPRSRDTKQRQMAPDGVVIIVGHR